MIHVQKSKYYLKFSVGILNGFKKVRIFANNSAEIRTDCKSNFRYGFQIF
jgi:hypothetical protein